MITKGSLEGLLGDLSTLINSLRDDQFFDEADTIESAVPYLHRLLTLDVLPNPVTDEVDTTPKNQEALRKLVLEMKGLQNEMIELKVKTADVRAPLDELRLKKIPEMMQSLEITTTTFVGLGRVQLAGDLYASTKKGCKDAAMQWLRDTGHESLIKEGYNASSVKAIFRAYIKEGTEIPEEIFSVTPFTRASIVKA